MPRLTLITTGGTLSPDAPALVDPLADIILRGITADISIVGCKGITVETRETDDHNAVPDHENPTLRVGFCGSLPLEYPLRSRGYLAPEPGFETKGAHWLVRPQLEQAGKATGDGRPAPLRIALRGVRVDLPEIPVLQVSESVQQ